MLTLCYTREWPQVVLSHVGYTKTVVDSTCTYLYSYNIYTIISNFSFYVHMVLEFIRESIKGFYWSSMICM